MSGGAAVPVVRSGIAAVDRFAEVVKQNLDWLTGQQRNAPTLKELPATATLEELIEQHNQVVRRLQF